MIFARAMRINAKAKRNAHSGDEDDPRNSNASLLKSHSDYARWVSSSAHPGCPQLQDSSRVSRASWQYWLQYLFSPVTTQLQAGCSHVWNFGSLAIISASNFLDSPRWRDVPHYCVGPRPSCFWHRRFTNSPSPSVRLLILNFGRVEYLVKAAPLG
jgi:hypothetical protein